MGRKKKKKSSVGSSPFEGADSTTAASPAAPAGRSRRVDSTPPRGKSPSSFASAAGGEDGREVRDALEVQLLTATASSASGGRRSADPREAAGVVLADDDSVALDVVPGDWLILLAIRPETYDETPTRTATEIVFGAAFCRASTIRAANPPASSMGGPPSRRTPGGSGGSGTPRKSKTIAPGTIQLTSESVADVLFRRLRSSPEGKQEDKRPLRSPEPLSLIPTTTEVPKQTPVSSPKAFSFKDAINHNVSTPKSAGSSGGRTTPTSSGCTADKAYQPVWLVPANSPLGRWVGLRLCVPAEKIVLRIVGDGKSSNGADLAKQPVRNILKRTVLAHIAGRYVQKGERLRCSFRGLPLELEVERAEGTVVHEGDASDGGDAGDVADVDASLESSLAKLAINVEEQETESDRRDSSTSSFSSANHVKDAVTAGGSSLRLFAVTYSTFLDFSSSTSRGGIDGTIADVPSRDREKIFVAGLSGTLEQVRSLLVTPLSQQNVFARGSIKAPKGILLHGPSGVGKSSLAKQIVNEIDSSSCEIEYVNCTSLQSKTAIVGEAERQLSRLFRISAKSSSMRGRRAKLLVLDDVHLICPKRGGHNPGTDRLAATLLSLIDGVDSSNSSRITILAITSNPSLLDPALRRPGRIDAEVEVPIPDEASTRAEILRFQVADLGAELDGATTDENWLELGKLAKGFNGADCALAAKEAVRKSILKGYADLVTAKNGCAIHISIDDLKAAIRDTKPSAIKSVTVEIPQVHWSSIGGMEYVKRELREAVELPLTHGELFHQLRVPPPRGILLYGPPGCSKTLMARALATEGQMNFLAVKGPELLSKWLGESERALASLFRRARMASPCIIFFDEIDAIAMKRGSGDSSSSSRLLSQLLTELDGVNNTGAAAAVAGDQKQQRVVVIGATNRPDLLDSALTRPGRIDRMIYVGVPDAESRAQIFKISLNDRACGEIDVNYLAKDEISQGFSGAEIVAICRDAALLALEEADFSNIHNAADGDSIAIEMRHLIAATRDMKRQITPDMIAFYESFRRASSTS